MSEASPGKIARAEEVATAVKPNRPSDADPPQAQGR